MNFRITILFIVSIFVFSTQAQEKYNVIFIAVDDMNDWPSPFGGNPQAKTPNMERLVSKGLVFNKAFCSATVCGPSRSAIMTGYRPHQSGVYGNTNNLKHSSVVKDVLTIPEYFSKHGYTTLSMGKIFHHHGEDQGQWAWDVWNKTSGGGAPKKSSRPLNKLPLMDGKGKSKKLQKEFDWGPTTGKGEKTKDMVTSKWFAQQLREKHQKPFFMGVGISKPHLPWYVPQKYFDMYPLDGIIVPTIKKDDLNDILKADGTPKHTPSLDYMRVEKANKFKEATRAYLANISYVDDCIGVVLDALEASEYANNTIVVMWGDHGWHLGEKLKYGKTKLWEEAARVPLLMSVPNTVKKKTITDALVNLQDLYPTLVDLCALPKKKDIDGISFAPIFKKPSKKWDTPTLTTIGYNNHSIRSKNYRYIRWDDGIEEFYDHTKDPLEWTNLAGNSAYVKLIEEHRTHLPKANQLVISKPVNIDEKLIEFTKNDYAMSSVKYGSLKPLEKGIHVFLKENGPISEIKMPLSKKLIPSQKQGVIFKIRFLDANRIPDEPLMLSTSLMIDGVKSRSVKTYINGSMDWQEVRVSFSVPIEKIKGDYLLKTIENIEELQFMFTGKNKYRGGALEIKELEIYSTK